MGIFQIKTFTNKTVTFTMVEGVKTSQNKEVVNMSENTAPIEIAKNNFEGYLVIFMNPFYADPEETLRGPDTRIMDQASIMSYAPVNLQLRLRYDGTVIEKGSSIDELFAGLNSPLYYLL
jgi:hypothetical protein